MFRGVQRRVFSAASFLADQQEKHSDSYQEGKQSTDGKRQSPVPTLNGHVQGPAFYRLKRVP